MKKIKLAKKFLSLNLLFSILLMVLMALFAFAGLIMLIVGTVGYETGEIDLEVCEALIGAGTTWVIAFSCLTVMFIIPIVLTCISKAKLNKAVDKHAGTTAGILAMIAGYFSTGFGFAAGIMTFVTKDIEYKENI